MYKIDVKNKERFLCHERDNDEWSSVAMKLVGQILAVEDLIPCRLLYRRLVCLRSEIAGINWYIAEVARRSQ